MASSNHSRFPNTCSWCLTVSIVASIFAAFAAVNSGTRELDFNDMLSAVGLIIGAVALLATVTAILFSMNFHNARKEIRDMRESAEAKIGELNDIVSTQRQVLNAFLLVNSFVNETFEAMPGEDDFADWYETIKDRKGSDDHTSMDAHQASREFRSAVLPIRLLLQALQSEKNQDRIDACRDAVGALENLGRLADLRVCHFAKGYFEALPAIARQSERDLTLQQYKVLDECKDRILQVLSAVSREEHQYSQLPD